MTVDVGCAMAIILPALIAVGIPRPAAAQGTSPSTVQLPTTSSGADLVAGPSFQSRGLKETVVTASVGQNDVTLSLVIENKSKNDVDIAIIGPIIGVNGGETFRSASVSGIAYCNLGDKSESDQIVECLEGQTPKLPVQLLTLIEHGNAASFNVTLNGEYQREVTKKQTFAVSMTVAVMPDQSPNSDSADTLQGNHDDADTAAKLPKGMRFIGIGIPAIPLS